LGGITPPAPRGAVAQLGRDGQHAGAADLHALHAFVPAAITWPAPSVELEGLAAVLARVELRPRPSAARRVVQPAGVVHLHALAGHGLVAAAGDGVFVLQAGGGGDHGDVLSFGACGFEGRASCHRRPPARPRSGRRQPVADGAGQRGRPSTAPAAPQRGERIAEVQRRRAVLLAELVAVGASTSGVCR
jgi:hypothetical protein